jgi:hypothetical protein
MKVVFVSLTSLVVTCSAFTSPLQRVTVNTAASTSTATVGRTALFAAAHENGAAPSKKKVLVLGGDGFCGWPTSLYLSDMGHDVVIVDNLSRRNIDVELGCDSLTPIQSPEVSKVTYMIGSCGSVCMCMCVVVYCTYCGCGCRWGVFFGSWLGVAFALWCV